MSSLESFFVEDSTDIDIDSSSLTYEQWKILCNRKPASKDMFFNPVTDVERKVKYKKNAYNSHIKKCERKEKESTLKQKVLDDSSITRKACHDCGKEYPRVKEYYGEKINFWPNNQDASDGMRNFCGKWGTIYKLEGKIYYGCDSYRERDKHKTSENPKGIRRGGQTDRNDRMKYDHKKIVDIVKSVRKYPEAKETPQEVWIDWIDEQMKLNNGFCAGFAKGEIEVPLSLEYKKGGNPLNYPSIDRIDNSKGHTIENCQLTSMGYNYMANNRSEEEVLKFLKLIKAGICKIDMETP